MAELYRLAGGEVEVVEVKTLMDDLPYLQPDKLENLTVGRSKADLDHLDLISEWLLAFVNGSLTTANNSFDRAGYQAISHNYAKVKGRLLSVLFEVLSRNGSRLLSVKEGLKIAAAINYLKDVGLLQLDDFAGFSTFDAGDELVHLFEVMVASDPNDVFWSAFYLNDFQVAFEVTRLHLESFIVHLISGNATPDQIEGISSAIPGLLQRLSDIAGFVQNFHFEIEVNRYRQIFSRFSGHRAGTPRDQEIVLERQRIYERRRSTGEWLAEAFPNLRSSK